MKIVKSIPNILTSLNLVCGFLAIVFALKFETLPYAPYFIFIAAVFDFSDGFAARMLKAYSELGKQLDSLADMVSFGVAPGVIIYQLLQFSVFTQTDQNAALAAAAMVIPAMIPVFSALRLAKFNIDERQTTSFIGLPTPPSAILIASLALVVFTTKESWIQQVILNKFVLFSVIIADSFLMVSEIPMFSLKVKNLNFKDNAVQFIFLGLCAILLVFFRITAIPLIIILYVIISIIANLFQSKTTS